MKAILNALSQDSRAIRASSRLAAAAGPKSAASEMARLAEIKIGSCLIIGFAVQGEVAGFVALANHRPLETWDANLHLLMKLVGASLA